MRKTGMVVLALGFLSFQAQGAQYIVKFLNSSTFQQLNTELVQMRSEQGRSMHMNLLATGAEVSESLDQVEMMIVSADSEEATEALKKNPAVAYIEQEQFFPAPKFPRALSPVPGPLSVPMGRPWGIDAAKAPDAWAKGYKGQSVRVAVLDTGIDKDHPAVTHNFEKGQNFVSDLGSVEVNADDFADKVGHGTHVSGTIAAETLENGFSGVAPEAKLLMGRVCGVESCSTFAVVKGINWVIAEKADVLNMSLGSSWPNMSEKDALKLAEDAGVTVIAASGNDGKGMVSYPAAFETVLAVGAIDKNLKKGEFSNWGPQLAVVAPGVDVVSSVPRASGRKSTVQVMGQEIPSASFAKSKEIYEAVSGSMVLVGLGRPQDYVTPQGELDCKDKIAIAQRGEITFGEKAGYALSHGAKAIVIYNNQPGLLKGTLSQKDPIDIPAVLIDQEQGQKIVENLTHGLPVELSYVLEKTDYDSLQGTSMASPHAAGVAALIKSANHNLTPAQIRDIMKKTATPLSPTRTNETGTGVVNALAGVDAAVTAR